MCNNKICTNKNQHPEATCSNSTTLPTPKLVDVTTGKIDTLGRLTIPKPMRTRCGIHTTGFIKFMLFDNGNILIKKVTRNSMLNESTPEVTNKETDEELKKTLTQCLKELLLKVKKL